eukprot:scaffold314556_cov28-Tisochrysis_lutea.AAC.1
MSSSLLSPSQICAGFDFEASSSAAISYIPPCLRVSTTASVMTSVKRKSTSEHVRPFPKTPEHLSSRHHCERHIEVPAPARIHASPGAAAAASSLALSSAPGGGGSGRPPPLIPTASPPCAQKVSNARANSLRAVKSTCCTSRNSFDLFNGSSEVNSGVSQLAIRTSSPSSANTISPSSEPANERSVSRRSVSSVPASSSHSTSPRPNFPSAVPMPGSPSLFRRIDTRACVKCGSAFPIMSDDPRAMRIASECEAPERSTHSGISVSRLGRHGSHGVPSIPRWWPFGTGLSFRSRAQPTVDGLCLVLMSRGMLDEGWVWVEQMIPMPPAVVLSFAASCKATWASSLAAETWE